MYVSLLKVKWSERGQSVWRLFFLLLAYLLVWGFLFISAQHALVAPLRKLLKQAGVCSRGRQTCFSELKFRRNRILGGQDPPLFSTQPYAYSVPLGRREGERTGYRSVGGKREREGRKRPTTRGRLFVFSFFCCCHFEEMIGRLSWIMFGVQREIRLIKPTTHKEIYPINLIHTW